MSHGRKDTNHRQLQGRISSEESPKLTEIFTMLSKKSPVEICNASCPMYKDGMCKTLGTDAPLGEECLPQKFSKERYT